jgi:hypothetical protein
MDGAGPAGRTKLTLCSNEKGVARMLARMICHLCVLCLPWGCIVRGSEPHSSRATPVPARAHDEMLQKVVEAFKCTCPEKPNGHFGVTVAEKDLKTTPSWSADAANPPLAARKALRLAAPFAKAFLGDTRYLEWKLHGLLLKSSDVGGGLRKWYWVIHYEAEPKTGSGFTGQPFECYFVVLMDGKVLSPIRQNP